MLMKVLALHELLQALAWLEGVWVTEEPAVAVFPTMKTDLHYYDQINITSIGQPLLNYIAQSWHAESGAPLHRETGFLQPLPGTDKVALSVINNIGIFTVEQGGLTEKDKVLELKSTNILATDASMPTFPGLTETRRVFRKDGDDLEYVFYMATSKTPELTEHLRAKYKKVM